MPLLGIERKRRLLDMDNLSSSSSSSARLHQPCPALADCIYMAAERNTLALELNASQRFNFYPASPFPSVWWILQGEVRMVVHLEDGAQPRLSEPLPQVLIAGPARKPVASCSPGPVHALVLSFYPESWSRLWGIPIHRYVDQIVGLADLPASATRDRFADTDWRQPNPFVQIEAVLQQLLPPGASGASGRTMTDWLYSMLTHAAASRAGAGVRALQRKVRDWTGQSQRDLQLFERVQRAFAMTGLDASLAEVALGAGYSDQSHMGREVKRVSGLPPAQFLQRLQEDEAFWFYRLLGDRLQEPQ